MRGKPACTCRHLQARKACLPNCSQGQDGAEVLSGSASRAILASAVPAGFLGLSFPLCKMRTSAHSFQGYCKTSVS